MAMGSRRREGATPIAAAVPSEPMVAARYTPWLQLKAWNTSGISWLIRPPKTKALIGTPSGFSQSGSMDGHWLAGAVKRESGWAAGRPQPGVQSSPFQSIRCAGGVSVIPSHQMSPSSVSAVLVKIQFLTIVAMALGFDFVFVPGATPKNPASGLIARSAPSGAFLIQAMSSPTVVTFQPSKPFGGTSMARFVLPQALGKAAPR